MKATCLILALFGAFCPLLFAQHQTNIMLFDSIRMDVSGTVPIFSKFSDSLAGSNLIVQGSSAVAYNDSDGNIIMVLAAKSDLNYDIVSEFLDSSGNKLTGCIPNAVNLWFPAFVLKHPTSSIVHFFYNTWGVNSQFICQASVGNYGLGHSTIDISTNPYSVITCNELVYENKLSTIYFLPIKHSNGKDWWILSHIFPGDTFVKFFLQDNIMFGPFFQTAGTNFQCVQDRIIYGGNFDYNYENNEFLLNMTGDFLETYNFDRCSGNISYKKAIRTNFVDYSNGGGGYTSYFSMSKNYIYTVGQYWLIRQNINTLKLDTIALIDSFTTNSRTVFFHNLYVNQNSGDIYFHYRCSSLDLSQCDTNLLKYIGVIENADSVISKVIVRPKAYTTGRLAFGYFPQEVYMDTPAENPARNGCVSLGVPREESIEFELFPNPATTNITLKANLGKLNGQLSLYNLAGQVIYQTSLSNETTHEWNVSGLPNGIYYLRLTDGSNEPFVQKVVVE
jgi:hypothetical protein